MRQEQHTFSAVLRDDLELHGVGLGLFSLLRFFVSHDEWFWWWASLERQGRGGLCSEGRERRDDSRRFAPPRALLVPKLTAFRNFSPNILFLQSIALCRTGCGVF